LSMRSQGAVKADNAQTDYTFRKRNSRKFSGAIGEVESGGEGGTVIR